MRYDWIVIGSGFGGSVSALRLVERGYRVLLIEKGRRFGREDFARSNWDLKRWMWMPALRMKGIFQMSFFEHATILHGVGFGGGSLTYANTLPMPKAAFFKAPSWAHLADWQAELSPHYLMAQRMLGAATNPRLTLGDRVLKEMARDMGREEHFGPTNVAVFFGEPGKKVPDPYFDGQGPDRTGCIFCGACMTGCRVGAKNTLDQNYLYLAEQRGLEVLVETEVMAVRPSQDIAGGKYAVETRPSFGGAQGSRTYFADRVVFAGGVMGTVPLLLKMREDPSGLPGLSSRLGDFIRTNSEAVFGVISTDPELDFSEGIAITSILHTDEHSHIEPVRYARGSGFFRTMTLPHAPGRGALGRSARAILSLVRKPATWARALSVADFSKQTQVLLYMRTLEGTLGLRLGRNLWTGWKKGPVTRLDDPAMAPKAFIPEATELAERFADKVNGVVVSMLTETLLGVPTTAHILGGCCMGASPDDGVIDAGHRVFGYDGLYVIDGSAVSANPGVNPSLTITALAERAMSKVPPKGAKQ